MASHQLKLTYFDGPGRGELCRLALVAGGISFDDHRIDGETFKALKPTLPLGQVPVLEIDGMMYPQSYAIARYAARLGGLYPENPLDSLQVDVVVETFVELLENAGRNHMLTDEVAKAAKAKELQETAMPKAFAFVQSRIAGPFVLGGTLSLADLVVFDVIEHALKYIFPTFDFAAYDKVAGVITSVRTNEKVAAYLSQRAQ